MYKKAAEFWAELRVELLSASAFLSEEKPNSSQVWRLYWASHQVPHLQLIMKLVYVNFHGIMLLKRVEVFYFVFYSDFLGTCVCQLRCLLR